MKKIITYGTFDFLHYGHIRLLERAKALGDYLIVGVTADDFDKVRGKINVQQSLMERIEGIRATGIADEIIVEEYEGQKIDDIRRYDVDVFTVGSDWIGKFDYLKEYCEVIYLERTQGVSSSEIRAQNSKVRIGIAGDSGIVNKYKEECSFVNGLELVAVYTHNDIIESSFSDMGAEVYHNYDMFLEQVDAIYLATLPQEHYAQIKMALNKGKHVLCESPVCMNEEEYEELLQLAKVNSLILMDAIKTAYSTAYNRLVLLAKEGKIGRIVSVDATCTSLLQRERISSEELSKIQNSICAWGPTALLPIFQLLGENYISKNYVSYYADEFEQFDLFTKIDFVFPKSVASIKVGKGVKSEGELIVSGTEGYIYVPAPWWKTDYFEIRYENQINNKRYFYQLDGEGIRYELLSFLQSIEKKQEHMNIEKSITKHICKIIREVRNRTNNQISQL